MVSTVYLAAAANKLDLELKIIRHFLLHPGTRAARDAFIAEEMKERTASMEGFLASKPDRDQLDDLLSPTVLHSQKKWLEDNLHHLKEFSENRLNQMELILRYTLFEGCLQKIVGSLLWEYPELRKKSIHDRLQEKPGQVKAQEHHRRRLKQHPDGERIAWTIATVQTVDHLPFDKWKGATDGPRTIYLKDYLADACGLTFSQPELWPNLERLRRMRNHIVHRSLELLVSGERIQEAAVYLANFPTVLALNAAKLFPRACSEERPDEGDDGTPAYVLMEDYF